MEINSSSYEHWFIFCGSETEDYELDTVLPITDNDGSSLPEALTQDLNVLAVEDELEAFEPGSESLLDLLDALEFPSPLTGLPVPFSQEPRHPTSGQCRFSVTFSEPVSAEICTADLIRLIVRHPARRPVAHRTWVLRGSLGTRL